MAAASAPDHLFLFNTGNPNDAPVFTSAGKFIIDLPNPPLTNIDNTGKITLRALDNSWITQIDMINVFFSGNPRELNGELIFTTKKGTPPFPATLNFGPIPTNQNIQIISDPDIINNPNLFAFVSLGSPPQI